MATASTPLRPSASAAKNTSLPRVTSEGNGVRYGLYTAAVMIAYTLVAAFAGFLGYIEAGSLNVLIIMLGVVLAIRHMSIVKGRHMGYFQGFSTGIITALVASALLGAAFWLLGGISHEAVMAIRARDLFGSDLGILISGLGIILLGTMTGVITSLIAMQYYRVGDEGQTEVDEF